MVKLSSKATNLSLISKELRITIEELIKNENLSNKSIELIKPDVSNDETSSKIIKIMIMTPNIGKRRLESLSDLSSDSFAWTTKEFKKNMQLKQYQIVNENKIFFPWKLIYKK